MGYIIPTCSHHSIWLSMISMPPLITVIIIIVIPYHGWLRP